MDIPRGAAWDNAIEREIRACSTMLVVLSHVAVASNNVRDEIAFAKDEGKRIVPIMIENCPLPIALRRIQYIDFTGDRVRALAELHAALLNGPVAESPALQPHRFRALPVKPTPRPVRIAVGWALLAGVLLGTGLASVFWMRGVQTGTADRRLVSPGAATASLGGGFMKTCVDIIRGPVVSAVEPALPPAAQEAFAIVTESEADQRKARNLRLVAPLFSEEIHVLARRQVAGLRDLQGARVAAGPPGLGSRFTAERLFSGLEIRPQWLDLGPEPGVCAVLAGQADAMVYVAGKPVGFFARLTELRERFPDALKGVQLLSVPTDARLPDCGRAVISAQDYPWLAAPIETLATSALLVSYRFAPGTNPYQDRRCKQLSQLGAILRSEMPSLRNPGNGFHEKWSEVDLNQSISEWQRDECL